MHNSTYQLLSQNFELLIQSIQSRRLKNKLKTLSFVEITKLVTNFSEQNYRVLEFRSLQIIPQNIINYCFNKKNYFKFKFFFSYVSKKKKN